MMAGEYKGGDRACKRMTFLHVKTLTSHKPPACC